MSILVEDGQVVSGRAEIRAIENIENLRPELGVETLRDPPDVVVLEHGEVQRLEYVARFDRRPQGCRLARKNSHG